MTTYWKIIRYFGVFCLVSYFALVTSALAQTINYVPAPTGTPEIDWQNIQNGLDAMGPGETLQLAAGTYKIHRSLVFENWNGSLIGAGPDQSATIIEVSKATNGDLFTVIYEPYFDDRDFPGARYFGTPVFYVYNAQGLFRISNLTVKVTEIGVAEKSYVLDSNSGVIAWFIDVWDNNNQALIAGPLGAEVDVVIENSSFLGSRGEQEWGQPNHGIQLSGDFFDTVGDYTVRNSDFDGISTVVVNPIAMHDSNIVIENNTFTDSVAPIALWNNSGCTANILNNQATNVGWSSVMIFDNVNVSSPTHPCHVTVSGLVTHDGAGVYAENWSPWVPLTLVVSGNEINQRSNSDYAGIEAWGDGINLLAEQNRIHGEDAALWGPIYTNGLNNAVISNNQITGRGPAAIYIGVGFWGLGGDSGMTVTDNDVLGFRIHQLPALAGLGAPLAHYWIGAGTQNNLIEGQVEVSERVLDWGMNNTVINAQHIQQGKPDGAPGLSLK